MTQPCLEIVTYRVGATDTADRERGAAREHAQKLPGFAGWLQLSGHEPEARADVVVWANREAADNAARAVGSGAQFAPFRATITEFGGVGHFPLPIGALPFMQPGEGITLTRFRPRPGGERRGVAGRPCADDRRASGAAVRMARATAGTA